MSAAGNLVWLSHLAGEARQRLPVAIPRAVFVAHPQRHGTSPPPAPNPGPAQLIGWLYRTDASADPTHAEVRFGDGREAFVPAAMIFPANRITPIARHRPRQEARA